MILKLKPLLMFIFSYCLFLTVTSHANDLLVEVPQEENGYGQILDNERLINNTENALENSWLPSFIDQRKIEGYQNWISAVKFILNPGDSICPSEGSLSWAVRKCLQLKDGALMILNGNQFPEVEAILKNPELSSEEKNDRINEIYNDRKLFTEQTVVKYSSSTKQQKDSLDEALVVLVPAMVVGVPTAVFVFVDLADIIKKSATYSLFAGVMNNIWSSMAASASVIIATASSSASHCFSNRYFDCSTSYSVLKDTLSMSFNSDIYSDVEEHIGDLAALQLMTTSARLAYQLPYSGAVKLIRDAVVPLSLIPLLNFNAQRRPETLSQKALECTAAAVAYGSISSTLNPTYAADQLKALFTNFMNILFMHPETKTPIDMMIVIGVKEGFGFLYNQCNTTINSVVPLVVMAVPAIYMEANDQRVPVINIKPKFLLVGAMIAGDAIASAQEGFPKHLLIPIILITTNLPNAGQWKTLGWSIALLFPPLNYFLGTQNQ